MKKIFILILIIFISATSLRSSDKVMMWALESPSSTIYLLGSIHVAQEGFYPLNDAITMAYDSSDALVIETDATKLDQQQAIQMMIYSDGQTLKDNVSPEVYKKLIERGQKAGIPEVYLSQVKPFAAIMMIEQLNMQKIGFKGEYGIDFHFIELAKEEKKPIYELENVESQLAFFEEFDKLADLFVDYSLREIDSMDLMFEEMARAWKDGDSDAIYKLVDPAQIEEQELKDLMKKLNDDRNVKMAEKIKGYLDTSKNYFVVVGTAHLVGPNSIISILEKDERYIIYQIDKVKNETEE